MNELEEIYNSLLDTPSLDEGNIISRVRALVEVSNSVCEITDCSTIPESKKFEITVNNQSEVLGCIDEQLIIFLRSALAGKASIAVNQWNKSTRKWELH